MERKRRRKDGKWIEIAEKNGISSNTYRARVDVHGWTPEKAATSPVKKRSDREWLKIAEQNGVERSVYSKRVDEMFWPPEEAASTPPMTKQEVVKKAIEARLDYRKIRSDRILKDKNNLFKLAIEHFEIAEQNGISKETVKSRVTQYGWTVQEAITKPVKKGNFIKPEGYQKYFEIAKRCGIHRSTFESRVKRGWDLETAATKPLVSQKERRRADKEWIDKAINNDIDYHLYWNRVNRGWTPEEAATTPPLKTGEFLNDQRRENSRQAFKEFKN